MDNRSHQEGNKKIIRSKRKQRHIISKSLGHYESSTERKIDFMGAFNKRSRNQQINDLTLQLKALEKKSRPTPKVVEDRK